MNEVETAHDAVLEIHDHHGGIASGDGWFTRELDGGWALWSFEVPDTIYVVSTAGLIDDYAFGQLPYAHPQEFLDWMLKEPGTDAS